MSAIIRRRRVHPEPPVAKLFLQEFGPKDAKAPWSKPRGYDTTILEEAFAYKAAVREMRRQEAAAATSVKPVKPMRLKKSRSWHLRNLLPAMPDLQLKERLTRFIGTLFCIRAETEAYIQHQKVDGAIG